MRPCLPHLWQIIELGYCLFLFIPAPDLNPGTTYMAPNSILSSCCLLLRGWNLGWCPDERYNAESACSAIISAVMMSGGRASLTCSYTVGFKPLMNWNKIDWSSGLSFPSSTTISLKRSMYLVTEVVCFKVDNLLLSLSTWSTSLKAFSSSALNCWNERVAGRFWILSHQVLHHVKARPLSRLLAYYCLWTGLFNCKISMYCETVKMKLLNLLGVPSNVCGFSILIVLWTKIDCCYAYGCA
jgi:hypothetical protein